MHLSTPILIPLPLHIPPCMGIIAFISLPSVGIAPSSLHGVEAIHCVFLGRVVAGPVAPYLGGDGRLVVRAREEYVGTAAHDEIGPGLEKGALLGAVAPGVPGPDELKVLTFSTFGGATVMHGERD